MGLVGWNGESEWVRATLSGAVEVDTSELELKKLEASWTRTVQGEILRSGGTHGRGRTRIPRIVLEPGKVERIQRNSNTSRTVLKDAKFSTKYTSKRSKLNILYMRLYYTRTPTQFVNRV